ncbi:Uncharacterised protein [Achromobacter xylosoxidans]|nr:Uncharacterised protein [Achromobacter xylosoxidans]
MISWRRSFTEYPRLSTTPSSEISRLPFAVMTLASFSRLPEMRNAMSPPARMRAPVPSDTWLSRVTVLVTVRSRKLL